MTARGVTAGLGLVAAVALVVAACSGSDDGEASPTSSERTTSTSTSTTATAPVRAPSTTTTAYDPAAVEGQVEAAYLRSWDVYADAVYNLELDESALAEVFAEDALSLRRREIQRRMRERSASLVNIDHNYAIALADSANANVVDQFTNHQVLIDPDTKEPIEADPNEQLLVNFRLKLLDGAWRVVFIEKVDG